MTIVAKDISLKQHEEGNKTRMWTHPHRAIVTKNLFYNFEVCAQKLQLCNLEMNHLLTLMSDLLTLWTVLWWKLFTIEVDYLGSKPKPLKPLFASSRSTAILTDCNVSLVRLYGAVFSRNERFLSDGNTRSIDFHWNTCSVHCFAVPQSHYLGVIVFFVLCHLRMLYGFPFID